MLVRRWMISERMGGEVNVTHRVSFSIELSSLIDTTICGVPTKVSMCAFC